MNKLKTVPVGSRWHVRLYGRPVIVRVLEVIETREGYPVKRKAIRLRVLNESTGRTTVIRSITKLRTQAV